MSSPEKNEFVDYYQLLGIQPSAELTDIRKAYISKAKGHHPDAGGSTEFMQLLNKAYNTLSNATAKASYDMLHSFQSGTTPMGTYKYGAGRTVRNVDDMSDTEIDVFLNALLAEYRADAPKSKHGLKQWFKNHF